MSFRLLLGPVHGQTPLALHPDKPHYFTYKNKLILLITSAEHYGAVINQDFAYIKYLDALQQQGMNSTRVFTSSNVEREQDIKWMGFNNTLAPKPGKVIKP